MLGWVPVERTVEVTGLTGDSFYLNLRKHSQQTRRLSAGPGEETTDRWLTAEGRVESAEC